MRSEHLLRCEVGEAGAGAGAASADRREARPRWSLYLPSVSVARVRGGGRQGGCRSTATPTRRTSAQNRRATKGIRFAVGEPEGAHSSVWRMWMNNRRDDVYISVQGLGAEMKVSLHPRFWYYGFTHKHVEGDHSLLPHGSDRKLRVWERPDEFGVGWTRAFDVIVSASEVVDAGTPYTGSEAVWLPAPEPGEVVYFTVLLSKPGAARGGRGYPCAEGFEHSTEFITRLDMATGEQLG